MSENPVRKASEEAAKSFFERHAPVLWSDQWKCRCNRWGLSRELNNVEQADKSRAEHLTEEFMSEFDQKFLAPVAAAAEEAMAEKCAAGNALAEYTEDAVGRALGRLFYLVEYPDELVPVSETSDFANDSAIAFRELIERATAELRAEIANLNAQLAESVKKLENQHIAAKKNKVKS